MKNRIKVVHLGLRPFELLPKEEAFRMLCLEKTEKTKVIGTIAELHPVKGLQYGIDAFALIRKEDPSLYENLLWAIIGEGEYRSELERMIKEKKLENKIYLLGFKKDASKFMGAFDAFLLPSLSEAFGYVLLEAGFAKVPVITSKVGGIPEIIENDVTGILFMPKSAREISSSISKFLNNPEQCKTQAEIFSKKIGNDFTLEIMIKRTTDIYNYGTSK
jgi:L-malate glycosyltransferase